jgi:hypothetical protein
MKGKSQVLSVIKTSVLKPMKLLAPVAHPSNPGYSGGKNQEDHISKPTQASSS